MVKLLIIYTGGTIGMVHDAASNSLKPFDFEEITKQVPELGRFDYQLDAYSFQPLIDSSNVKPKLWVDLVNIISTKYNEYDGFVVLHGTDTMAYTASAISFMLENLAKPVIFTGSQLPIGEIRTDAKENFITAIEIAASTKNGKSIVPEVAIFFDYKLYRGNRSSKYSSSQFEAFQSVNYPPLAETGVHITYNEAYITHPAAATLITHTNIDTQVAILKLFPGMEASYINAILEIPGLKGVVMETFGSGNAPLDEWFIQSLKSAVNKGIHIFNVTQCSGGSVEQGRYETSTQLAEIGVISGADITTEAAITKLMFLLGKQLPTAQTAALLRKSLRGEMTV